MQKQAEECAKKNTGTRKVLHKGSTPSGQGDDMEESEPSSAGLKVRYGEPDFESGDQGSNETTTSVSDEEDDAGSDEKDKAADGGKDGSSSNKLNRDSMASSQAAVGTTKH